MPLPDIHPPPAAGQTPLSTERGACVEIAAGWRCGAREPAGSMNARGKIELWHERPAGAARDGGAMGQDRYGGTSPRQEGFSSRLMLGWEHRSRQFSGARPTAGSER